MDMVLFLSQNISGDGPQYQVLTNTHTYELIQSTLPKSKSHNSNIA